MTLEEKNKEKRKTVPLKLIEKVKFFIFPFGFKSNLFPVKDYNDSEIERFKKYGFEKKYNDAIIYIKMGLIFYMLIPIILLLFNS